MPADPGAKGSVLSIQEPPVRVLWKERFWIASWRHAAAVNEFWSEVFDVSIRTVKVSGSATMLSCLCGVPVGVFLGRSEGVAARALVLLSHVCLGLPPVVVGLLLYLLLSRSGPLGGLEWLFTTKAMVAAQFVLALPFVVAVVATTVASVPLQLEEQLLALGASRWQARLMTLREARFGLALAVAAAFGRSISEVGAVLIVGGNIAGHTRVLTTAIVLETGRGRFDVALALAAVLLSLSVAANSLILVAQLRSAAIRFLWAREVA